MMKRRTFLAGVGGAFAGATLGGSQLVRVARASKNGRAPLRLLIIHKPCGTVPSQYNCAGNGKVFTLSPLLVAYKDLRPYMTIVEGIDVRKKENTPGQDHGNAMVTFMTGGVTIRAEGLSTVTADRPSIDHLLTANSAFIGDTPVRYLQVAADSRTDDFFTSVLTYAGRATPLPPEPRPLVVYTRLFGTLMDGGNTPTNAQQLARAIKRKQSVLDYSKGSLSRLTQRLGSDHALLDQHLAAVREVENLLSHTLSCSSSRALGESVSVVDPNQPDAQHAQLGRAHLNIVRTAFQCDLTRVATFGWAVGPAYVNLSGLVMDTENVGYHYLTHNGRNREHDEILINRWYSEQIAAFLISMRDTPDFDGRSLLDNTLVVVWSEMCKSSHTFENVPIQLFGRAGGRLEGGRLLNFGGRSSNDLWLTIANALGVPMASFGDPERCQGVLSGLFS
jgi:hypothetical protein